MKSIPIYILACIIAGQCFAQNSVLKDSTGATKAEPTPVETSVWDTPPGEYKAPVKTPTDNCFVASQKNTYEQGLVDGAKQCHAPWTTVLGFVSTPVLFVYPYGTAAVIAVNTVNIRTVNPEAYTQNTNPEYLKGYKSGMRRKKLNNTIAGAGIATGVAIVGAAVITVIVIHELNQGNLNLNGIGTP